MPARRGRAARTNCSDSVGSTFVSFSPWTASTGARSCSMRLIGDRARSSSRSCSGCPCLAAADCAIHASVPAKNVAKSDVPQAAGPGPQKVRTPHEGGHGEVAAVRAAHHPQPQGIRVPERNHKVRRSRLSPRAGRRRGRRPAPRLPVVPAVTGPLVVCVHAAGVPGQAGVHVRLPRLSPAQVRRRRSAMSSVLRAAGPEPPRTASTRSSRPLPAFSARTDTSTSVPRSASTPAAVGFSTRPSV